MSPRPRETSDQEILAATARVMQRLGPTRVTLADVAEEAGIVPATIIQRFRTKRNLLLAACAIAPADTSALFAHARAKHKSPLKALIELYVECSGYASTPEAMVNGLAYLQIDLTDEDFHILALGQFRQIREETEKLLDEAVAARELRHCNTRQLARLLQGMFNGSMLGWGVFREGTLAQWMRTDVEALLAPYRSRSSRGTVRRPIERNRPKFPDGTN